MCSKTRKGLVRLTRKGLVADVLDSSIDLSVYTLFCSKEHFKLVVDHGAVGTWILHRVGGRSIRYTYTLTI